MIIKQVGKAIQNESFLWRYFDFQKFLSLAIEKSISFSRMDKMEDANEGISINQLLLGYGDEIDKEIVRRQKEMSKKSELKLSDRQKYYFLSCWLIHHRESVAMWNSYSDDNGLALKINSGQLIESITRYGVLLSDAEKMKNMFHGKVAYIDFLNPIERLKFKQEINIIGFQKDESFEHEKEYRFLIKQDIHNYRDDLLSIAKLKLNNFDDLKFDLIFHPKMSEWKKENIKKILKVLKLKNFTPKNSELKLKAW